MNRNMTTTSTASAHTYALVIAEADIASDYWVDHTTPEGQFGVTALILGINTDYYFEGEPGDLAAPIVSRIESHLNGQRVRYEGNRIKGGMYAGVVR